MQAADKGTKRTTGASQPNGKSLVIGLVQSRFNAGVTDALALACREELIELGVQAKNIDHVQVPGALEIALALQALAETDKYDALVALGCIVRGETYHFELVANESGAAVTRVGLDYSVPIANAILTTESLDQAIERQVEKGRDAAHVAVEMALLLESIA